MANEEKQNYPQDEIDKGTQSLATITTKKTPCCGGDRECSSTSFCSSKPAPAEVKQLSGNGSCSDESNCAKNESRATNSCCASKALPNINACCDGNHRTSSIAAKSGEDCCGAMSLTVPAVKSCCGENHGPDSKDYNRHNLNGKNCGSTSCDSTKVHSSGLETDCCSGGSHQNKSLKCLAVIHPGESAVDVFDTTGRSKTFRVSNYKGKDISGKKLCFSTHGAADDVGGMLTPCFEGSGKLAETEDGCRCGIDTQHLHAHVYDPEVCGVDENGANCSSSAAKSKATDWRFLSQVTLHLDDNKEESISYMPITASMPKVCNSDVLHKQLANKGLKLSHWLRWRNGGTACGEKSYCGVKCRRHRLYPVQHEDHTDYLIHNEATGGLHMEHPNCDSCGDVDIHGRFRLVHTRSWMGDKSSRINLHVFEVHEEPFHLFDLLSGLFELESSRVLAATAVVEDSSSRVGRSQFSVKGICCASEIPQVESILRPLFGISKISVNPTTKMGEIELIKHWFHIDLSFFSHAHFYLATLIQF